MRIFEIEKCHKHRWKDNGYFSVKTFLDRKQLLVNSNISHTEKIRGVAVKAMRLSNVSENNKDNAFISISWLQISHFCS